MTPTIAGTLEEIKQRFADLKLALDKQKELNLSLQQQISDLTNEQLRKDEQVQQMEAAMKQLESTLAEMEAAKQQQQQSLQSPNKDEEIDVLVKEIDRCINQIKSNL